MIQLTKSKAKSLTKDQLFTEYTSILKLAQEMEANLSSEKERAFILAREKKALQESVKRKDTVIHQILEEVQKLVTSIKFPSKITWVWVVMNISSVAKTLTNILDILKNRNKIVIPEPHRVDRKEYRMIDLSEYPAIDVTKVSDLLVPPADKNATGEKYEWNLMATPIPQVSEHTLKEAPKAKKSK